MEFDEVVLDGDGRPADPLLLVDLDAPAEAMPPSDRIRVGVGTGEPAATSRERAAALDLTLVPLDAADDVHSVRSADPVADAELLQAAAEANPRAALVLAQVLRADGLPVPAALDVESFAYSTLLGGPEFKRWLIKRGPRPLPPPARDPVLVERAGGLLEITLNRPERRNAYGREVRDALVDALRLAVLDETVDRVLLRGAGPVFSAGGDLDEFGTTPDLATAHFVRTRGGAGRLLHQLADRVEVRLQGSCVGAGVELPAFAGTVTAHPDATFRLPEVGMGLVPGAGGTVSLPRRIGRWRTLYLALSGRALDAATAVRWGLVDAIER
ncbi:enoyl-CoA hydratase/isomerase family protein [Amycolatopsis acidiphila]|uniref:Enoyl-CoA hydratase/isomerase family protein n=1 Tax=Amycolatopsis acidiphila TaxID=715473 RepID=A0A557ZZH8_9PSEU|nr:enoyl-CoA hydratase/isomerase family protein [Amycolatopsis acidiphila]TVT17419.1 enoyl-CoA hydratase/isomerase family protein [Amycolatopsis acidiphila]UIJ57262.1 enoyl-CoA hydratase/isomerase family protein [Amycolatopsis acidiphila]GHG52366.1 enoyl-CoA hydratase [Amycolatopsis acidiphila]